MYTGLHVCADGISNLFFRLSLSKAPDYDDGYETRDAAYHVGCGACERGPYLSQEMGGGRTERREPCVR